MKQLATGSYSEVWEHDGIVLKFIQTAIPSEAQQQHSDVRQYYQLLHEIINCFTKLVLEFHSQIFSLWVRVSWSSWNGSQGKMRSCKRVNLELNTTRPVGYDASPENFIVNLDMEATCIDVYPPRLGFKLDTQEIQPLSQDELLVDYPNGGHASEERWPELRHAYE